jgi:flagellar basal-body rod protein FlgC
MDISISGIEANRVAMEIISSNLANINTTRTEQGGPYRRKIAVIGEKPLEFSETLAVAEKKLSGGVEVKDIIDDPTPLQRVYDPGNPDADSEGYVTLPNVSLSKEMVDMVAVGKYYQADITAYTATKRMAQEIMQIQ